MEDEEGEEEEEEEGEEEEGGEEEKVPGVGAIEIDVLGLTVGAVEMNRVGVEATGADGAPLTEGADVTDVLGVVPVNAIILTTLLI